MNNIITLIDDTKKIMDEIQKRKNTIIQIKDGTLYKNINIYNNIFNQSSYSIINTTPAIYKQSPIVSRNFNMELFNLEDFKIETIDEEIKQPNNYSDLTIDLTIIKEITNKYANLDFLKYESLFNSLTFSNKNITLSNVIFVNAYFDTEISLLKSNYLSFESKLLLQKNTSLAEREKNIKSITWSWGKKQVEEALINEEIIQNFKVKLTTTINTNFSDKKDPMKKLLTYIIVLLLKGATISTERIVSPVLSPTSSKSIDLRLPVNIYSLGDKKHLVTNFFTNFVDNINKIKIDDNELFYYSNLYKTLELRDSINKNLFKNFSSINTYGELFSLNYDDLFENKYIKIINKYDEENKENDRLNKLLTDENFSDKITSMNLMLNIGKIYNNRDAINELYDKITEMVGGDATTYIKNNLLFDKGQMLNYVENLGQLSVLNEIIRQNDKILDKVNLYKEYVTYFKSIIDIINKEPFDKVSLFNKVLINFNDYFRKDNKSANAIYSKLNKSNDYIILLSLNDTYISILNK
jgi:hypothetical protein